MEDSSVAGPIDSDVEKVRLQAEEHPLIEDVPPATLAEHCLQLMHLRAYDEAVGYAAGRDVLDVGCNTGYGTLRFAPVANRVVGVDVSRRAIEAARQRAPDGRPEFIVTTGFALPFPDASFDLVTCFQVLEHVPEPTAFLSELARITRPHGTIILATPNAAIRLYPGMAPWNRFHVHEYVAVELAELLRSMFGGVTVLGMFGAPELYETEIRRVDAVRQRIRRTEEAAARQTARREAALAKAQARSPERQVSRPRPIRLARALLPPEVRAWLRSVASSSGDRRPHTMPAAASAHSDSPLEAAVVATAPATAARPEPSKSTAEPDMFLRFSVEDLWYSSTDLDRAMDLLAICETAPEPAEAMPALG
jgi:2-polyprenyl-3-methyl-5-hydroxy-6-metoxy-1,4-benzoquinol methylase